jgi:hypothetical protein
MNTTVTIEQVAHQFQIWRQNKIRKFDPIPTHLKDLITQLLPHYRQQTIMRQLNISSTTLSSIKKSHLLNHKKSHTKLRTLHKTNSTNASTNSKSKSKSSLSSESKISFIPFQLTTPSLITSHGSTTSHGPIIDSPTSALSSAPPSNCATCHITKTDGSTLIIKTSDPKSVIQAFLCSN